MDRNGLSRHSTQNTPNVLIMKCENAVRLAETLAPNAAMFDVMVVPMFSPSTMMIPSSSGMAPVAQMVMVMAMMAADDCTQSVSTVPMSRKMSMVKTYGMLPSVNCRKKLVTAGFSSRCMSIPVALRVPSPRKRNPAPKRKSPKFLCFFM